MLPGVYVITRAHCDQLLKGVCKMLQLVCPDIIFRCISKATMHCWHAHLKHWTGADAVHMTLRRSSPDMRSAH